MSKQPSERAFDVASEWQGHQLKCSIYHAPGRDDADCTCIVRDLALAIDAAIAAACAEAYEKAAMTFSEYVIREECDIGGRDFEGICIAIRALAAQEARDGK